MTQVTTTLIPLIEERFGLSFSELVSFCQHWQITQMALFGSVLRSDFNSDSDIDILLRFAPHARQGLLTLAQIKHQLQDRTGRAIDLITLQSVEQSDNWIRRAEILSTAVVIYEQG
jgi:uncharacterized protein